MTPATRLRLGLEEPLRWDWWPLVRLLTVLFVFGTFAHFRLGWTFGPGRLAAFPREVFEVFSLFTLLSFGLAHLYLVLLMFPIYAVVTLNDSFYDAAVWVGRTVIRLRPGRVLSLVGLGGELLLFGAGAALILRALH